MLPEYARIVVVGCEFDIFDAFVNVKLFGIDPCHIHLLSRPQEVSISEDDLETRQTTTRRLEQTHNANQHLKLYNRNDFQVRANHNANDNANHNANQNSNHNANDNAIILNASACRASCFSNNGPIRSWRRMWAS